MTTDPQTPDFTVVDRRHASGQTESETQATAATEVSAHDASAPDPIEVSGETEEPMGEPNAASGEESFLPEPGFLLTLAATRMDTRGLMKALLSVFDGHAWQAMGLIANPVSGQVEQDLPSAQLAIDCVQFLLSKTEAELPDAERREAQRRLSDLRMNYVSKIRGL